MFDRIKDIIFKIKDYDRLEYDYSRVLCYVTDGLLSKTSYEVNGLYTVIDDVLAKRDEQTYKEAEKDLTDVAAFSSGPDGFYYGKGYQQGKKDTEKHLGWHSVEESLPPVDEEVIVLTDEINETLLPDASFVCVAHIVDPDLTVDVDGISYRPVSYNGWNVPGVKFWMPMPKLPKEEKK